MCYTVFLKCYRRRGAEFLQRLERASTDLPKLSFLQLPVLLSWSEVQTPLSLSPIANSCSVGL